MRAWRGAALAFAVGLAGCVDGGGGSIGSGPPSASGGDGQPMGSEGGRAQPPAPPSPPSSGGAYDGPFRILVLSKTLGFHHDSIPACQQMLRDLGRCVDAASCAKTGDAVIADAHPDSSFTVDVAGAPAGCPELPSDATTTATSAYSTYVSMGCDGNSVDMSEFGAANLAVGQFQAGASKGSYQMVFSCNPSGTVFSQSGGASADAARTAVQGFVEAGGAYGGLDSAIDIGDLGTFPWYANELVGSSSLGAAVSALGTVVPVAQNASHPVMQGIPNLWTANDVWLLEDLPVDNANGFQVLATLSMLSVATPSRQPPNGGFPVVWVKPFPVGSDPTGTFEGRMFYTVRGDQIAHYREPYFRQLVHQGILWAAHRM